MDARVLSVRQTSRNCLLALEHVSFLPPRAVLVLLRRYDPLRKGISAHGPVLATLLVSRGSGERGKERPPLPPLWKQRLENEEAACGQWARPGGERAGGHTHGVREESGLKKEKKMEGGVDKPAGFFTC